MLSTFACFLALCAVPPEPHWHWQSAPVRTDALPATLGKSLSAAELSAVAAAEPVAPFASLTCGVRAPSGAVWVGSERGLMYLAPGAPRWKLFHSQRWLPSDHVLNISVVNDDLNGDVAAIVQMNAGFQMLRCAESTLDAKMDEIHANLRRLHLRDGLVGEITLHAPGDLTAAHVQPSNDNDGLWTSMYVAAEAFRFGATGNADAKANARRSLEALMFQERITGISGFVARSFVPIADDPQKYGGEWHRSADGKWWWKGDTSSDELDGHYFAYGVYYDLCADETEREEIRGYVQRITDHILDHGYYYVGPPGQPTTWGVWAPEKLNHDLEWIDDRGLNSLEMLSHLKVAEYMTGKARYAEAAHALIEHESYATNTVLQKMTWPPGAVNHSDDELAFLAYYPLLMYERDAELRKVYLASLTRSWRIERPEHSPFFNFIFAAGVQASDWPNPQQRPPEAFIEQAAYDGADCIAWFRDVPVDTISWRVDNTGRRDIALAHHASRAERALSLEVLPASERRTMKWNGDPHELTGGGDGRERDDGAFILLPYWMGKYHRLLE